MTSGEKRTDYHAGEVAQAMELAGVTRHDKQWVDSPEGAGWGRPPGVQWGEFPTYREYGSQGYSGHRAQGTSPHVAQGYTPPSWMQGWLSPMGLRPLGAQTAVTPTQKMALWEQKAAEAHGSPIRSLSDYERHVEPFRQLWGETHEAGSQRLTPKARGRSSSWLAARQ